MFMQENAIQNLDTRLDATTNDSPEGSGFRQQAANLLASREGAEEQASLQAAQLVQKGLEDVKGQNDLTGILQLMKAAQLKPEIIQNQEFFSYLKSIVGDVPNPHPEGAHFGQAGQSEAALPDQPSTTENVSQAATESEESEATPKEPQPGEIAEQAMQMINRGLVAIASGDKLTGIVSLMQAAQANPSIISDLRFQSALQSALSYGSKNANGKLQAADASIGSRQVMAPGAGVLEGSLPT
jgi:hypothetical protein